MKIIKAAVIIVLAGMLASCAGKNKAVRPASAPGILSVLNVSVDSTRFDPAQNEKIKIRYYVSKPALVTVRIYDASDALVRVLASAGPDKVGYNELAWDGRDELGAQVASSAYFYTVTAHMPESREIFTYDPTDLTGGQEIFASDLQFDAPSGSINYRLPAPAIVRARIGIKDGGPLLRTLINWEPQSAGAQTLSWDGWDDARVVNAFSGNQLLVSVVAYALPENAVIVRSQISAPWSPAVGRPQRPAATGAAAAGASNRLSQKKSSPPQFDMAFLTSAGALVQEDVPVFSADTVTVRVALSDADKLLLIGSRFEVLFFLDNSFLIEEEEGTSPLNYSLNLKGVNEGEHVLTVNVVGFPDRIAGWSKRFLVKKSATQ